MMSQAKKLILTIIAMFGRKPRMVELIEDGSLGYYRSWCGHHEGRSQRYDRLEHLQELLQPPEMVKAVRWLDSQPHTRAVQAANGFLAHNQETGDVDFLAWIEANVGSRLDPNSNTLWLFVEVKQS